MHLVSQHTKYQNEKFEDFKIFFFQFYSCVTIYFKMAQLQFSCVGGGVLIKWNNNFSSGLCKFKLNRCHPKPWKEDFAFAKES